LIIPVQVFQEEYSMFIKEKETGFRIQNRGLKMQGSRIHFSVFKAICTLSLLFCILFLMTGCGEKDNEHLVNARHKIQQNKYKEAQDISQLKNELKLVLSKESNNPEALCPLKALEIVESGANAGAQMVSEILTPINQLDSQIKKLESIDKDLLTDDDKNQLDKLTRKWNLSLEPTAKILSSNTVWIDKVGDPAFDLLIELLKATNPIIQNDVVKILVQLKSRSYNFLVKALGNENSMVRRQALIALGKIGDDRAVEHIASLLNDKNSGVRFYIPVSLELIGGEKIIEPLHLALKNEMSQVRMASAEILGRLKDETAASPLIELLGDDNSYVRASANDALLKIGAPSVPILMEVLQKKAENVNLSPSDFVGDKIGSKYKKELAKRSSLQASIASILGNMKDTSAITILLESMKMAPAGATEDEKTYAASVRTSAITALQTIGASAVNGLISMIENKSETETARVNAASVLGTIGDRRAVVPLINALKDENKNARAASATSLGTLKDRRALIPLIDALNDNDLVVRTNVAASLGLIADKMATQPLLNILINKEEREKLRTVALDSLGLIKDPIAMEPILTILIDEYEKDGIRKSASTAMRLMENVYPSEALIALLKGEMVYPILMPEKGKVTNWLKNEGDKNIDKNFTPLLEVSNGKVKREILAPDSGTLIKIYTKGGQSAELGAIIGLLSYKDKEIKEEERSSVRNMASSALGKVKGDNAVPALIDALKKDKNGAVRKNAASSLREIENAKARPALIDAMKHDDSGVVRSEAAYALGVGGLKNAENVPHLIDALQKDKYESTRVKAVWSLGELADKRAIDALKKAIVVGRKKGEKEAPTVINEAITALDKIAAPAVDPMLAVLKDKNVDEVPRSYAARILGLIESTNAVDQLITALKDDSVVVRSEAAKSLGLINDRRAVEPLISILKDENEWVTVRTNATWSLGNIKDERVVMPLIEALKSDVTAIHSNAVTALGTIKDKRAVLPLIQILENPKEDDTIRASAITALASIGDLSATGAIMTALKSTNLSLKQNAIVAVGDLAIKESVDTLIAMVKDMNELTALRASAAESLGKIEDKKAIGVLTERMADPNEPDTAWIKIATAAGKLKAPEVSAWVEQRAKDTLEPVTVRNAAFMALSGTGNNKDFATILEMVENATLEIRYGAALALGNSGRKDATQPMINRLQNDGEETVRYYTATALGTLADPGSEQALIKAFKEDGTASVKNASAIALGEIKGRNGITALISILQDNTKGLDHRWNSATALGNAKATEAIPALKTVLLENNGALHFEAAEALRKITGQSQGYNR
jgi:HEAT repeat protein